MVIAVLIALFLVVLCLYYRLVLLIKAYEELTSDCRRLHVTTDVLISGVSELYAIAEQVTTDKKATEALKEFRSSLSKLVSGYSEAV